MTEKSDQSARNETAEPACPVCGGWRLRPPLPASLFPLPPLVLHGSPASARAQPRAATPLLFCSGCGHISRPSLAMPGAGHHDPPQPSTGVESGLPDSHLPDSDLPARIGRIVRRYHLAGLRAGLVGGDNDPVLAFCAGSLPSHGLDDVRWLEPPSGPERPPAVDCDLLICSDALSATGAPARLLHQLKSASTRPRDTLYYFELPNAAWQLRLGAPWTLPLLGGNAFCAGSLRRLLRRGGFEILALQEVAAGRRLTAAARAASEPSEATVDRRDADQLTELLRQVGDYPARLARATAFWSATLRKAAQGGRKVLFWGAEPGTALLLDLLAQHEPQGLYDAALLIDEEPARQHRYLAASGVEVMAPAQVDPYALAVVVLAEASAGDAAAPWLARWRRARPSLPSVILA